MNAQALSLTMADVRNCAVKDHFATLRAADARCKRLRKVHPRLEAYQCPVCGGFVLGHSRDRDDDENAGLLRD